MHVNGLLGDYDGILAGCSGAYWILMGFTWIYDRGKKNTWNHLLDGWRLARVNWNVNMKRWDLTWQERRLWEKKHKTWVIV